MIPSLEVWPTKAKEVRSLHKIRLSLLNAKPAFQFLEEKMGNRLVNEHFLISFQKF